MAPGQPEGIFRVAAEGCRVSAGRIQDAREYELAVSASDGRHPEAEVRARLRFFPFGRAALRQAVPVRFSNASDGGGGAGVVLGVFERLTSSDSGASFELLSLNPGKSEEGHGTVDAYLALRENGVVLPREEALQQLRQKFDKDAGGSLTAGFHVSVGYSPCNEGPCLNGGECASAVGMEADKETNIIK